MDPYIGEIRIFAGNYAPLDWLFCWGQTVAVSQYQALFSLIGNTYGGSYQQNTFVLPDLRGKVPVHQGTGVGLTPRVWSQSGGTVTVPLVTGQLPVHTHAANANTTEAAPIVSPQNAIWCPAAGGRNGVALYGAPPVTVPMSAAAIGSTGGATGGATTPHNNMQPYVAINYIIATYGIYPINPN